MKKLNKLSLADCQAHFNAEENSVLSADDMKSIYGGTDPCDPGLCYFDGLAYLSSYYNYGPNNSCDYYVSSFTGSYSGDFKYDPSGNLMGITSTHTYEFASNYFYTQQLSNGTDIYNFFQQGGGGRVLTSMDITSGSGVLQTHAIILEGQNPNGSYHAWDATTNQPIDVPADQINAAMLIGICGEK